MRSHHIAAAALSFAALFAGTMAHAGTGQVTAEITGLTFEIIDTKPDDGIAPEFSFSREYALYSSFNDLRGWENSESVTVHHKGSIQVARPFGSTYALSTADVSRSGVQIWSHDGIVEGNLGSWTMQGINYSAGWGTGVKVTATGILTASNPDDVFQAAHVKLEGWTAIGRTPGPNDAFSQLIDLDQGTGTFTLSGYLQSDWDSGGTIVLSTLATMASVVTTPVPEPATYGMLLAGLGLLALRARKSQV